MPVGHPYSGPLIIRIFDSPAGHPEQYRWEAATHDELVRSGYPVPRILIAAETADIGAFVIMERLNGAMLGSEGLEMPSGVVHFPKIYRNLPTTLAGLHLELHRIDPDRALPPGMEDYDDGKLLAEAFLLTDWTWPAVFGGPPPRDVLNAYRDAWLQVFPIVHRQPRTLVLRDFHVDNLLVLEGRNGVARCGLLDFQDAVRGAGAYDLMSLLEDARRDIGGGLREAMLERYLDAFPGLDGAEFKTVYAILAAQRHAKVIGIFTRLCRRDGKPAYLEHIPRVWRLLEAALGHQALAPVAAWFDAHVPPAKRGVPPCPAAGT